MSDENSITIIELCDLLEKRVGLDHPIFKSNCVTSLILRDLLQLAKEEEIIASFPAKQAYSLLEAHGLVLMRLPGFWGIHVEKKENKE